MQVSTVVTGPTHTARLAVPRPAPPLDGLRRFPVYLSGRKPGTSPLARRAARGGGPAPGSPWAHTGYKGSEIAPEVTVNPGGGAEWDESPLDIQIPDDARELDRDVLAYHREQRAQRRRNRLRRLAGPLAGHGTVMPLLASILAVCLVAGAMLSVATFSPATAPGVRTHPATAAASSSGPAPPGPAPPRRPVRHRPQPGHHGAGNGAGLGHRQATRSAGASASADRPSGDPAQPPARLRFRHPLRPKDPASTREGATATISSVPTGVNRGGR